jgi:hypothetical protein
MLPEQRPEQQSPFNRQPNPRLLQEPPPDTQMLRSQLPEQQSLSFPQPKPVLRQPPPVFGMQVLLAQRPEQQSPFLRHRKPRLVQAASVAAGARTATAAANDPPSRARSAPRRVDRSRMRSTATARRSNDCSSIVRPLLLPPPSETPDGAEPDRARRPTAGRTGVTKRQAPATYNAWGAEAVSREIGRYP